MSAGGISHEEPTPGSPSAIALTMTNKQLLATVQNGQRIHFEVFDVGSVSGYLAGLDHERMFVLEPLPEGGFRKHLIARSGSPDIVIHSDRAYADEPERESMERIIGPFRQWVAINVMGQRPARSRPARSTPSYPSTARSA